MKIAFYYFEITGMPPKMIGLTLPWIHNVQQQPDTQASLQPDNIIISGINPKRCQKGANLKSANIAS